MFFVSSETDKFSGPIDFSDTVVVVLSLGVSEPTLGVFVNSEVLLTLEVLEEWAFGIVGVSVLVVVVSFKSWRVRDGVVSNESRTFVFEDFSNVLTGHTNFRHIIPVFSSGPYFYRSLTSFYP